MLGERGQVAEQQGRPRHERQDRHREPGVGRERAGQHQQHDEPGGLRADREEGRDRRGRPLVDVGHPDLEGKRADLEGDAGQHQHDADAGEEVMRVRGEEAAERVEVHPRRRVLGQHGIAGDAVEQDNAEKQDGGAQRAHDQVLQAGLERRRAAAEVAHEDVESDRHRLERHEQHHEVVALRQEHHRGGDHQDDVVELGPGHALPRQADGPQQAGQHGGEQEEHPHDLALVRVVQQAVEGVALDEADAEAQQLAGQDGQHAEERDARQRGVERLGQHDLEDEQRQGQAAEQHLGEDGHPVVAGGEGLEGGEIHGAGGVISRWGRRRPGPTAGRAWR